ncbi:MAG: ABC-2 type transport system permease protein [Azoarcus sp.]|nr:ABC-2 type transport system permease protein [Azoarcus sp.]
MHITGQFGTALALACLGAGTLETLPVIREEQCAWFNPNQNSGFSHLELLMMATLLLSCGTVAREKERGTIEQLLLVSPLTPLQILVPKVLAMTLVVLAGSMMSVFAVLGPVFHVLIKGSLTLFFALTALSGFTSSRLEHFIATVPRTLLLGGAVFCVGVWRIRRQFE